MPARRIVAAVADRFELVLRAHGQAGCHHRATQRDRHAIASLEEDDGKGLADQLGQRMGGPGIKHPQRTEQPAEHVEVMDQHLGDHEPPLVEHERLTHQ